MPETNSETPIEKIQPGKSWRCVRRSHGVIFIPRPVNAESNLYIHGPNSILAAGQIDPKRKDSHDAVELRLVIMPAIQKVKFRKLGMEVELVVNDFPDANGIALYKEKHVLRRKSLPDMQAIVRAAVRDLDDIRIHRPLAAALGLEEECEDYLIDELSNPTDK